MTGQLRRWLLDAGSIYRAASARLPDPSAQRELVVRAADIAQSWPELPVKRYRAVLTALIERVDAGNDRIDIRIRPSRLGALFDVAAPLPSAGDDECLILSVPVRRCRAGREISLD